MGRPPVVFGEFREAASRVLLLKTHGFFSDWGLLVHPHLIMSGVCLGTCSASCQHSGISLIQGEFGWDPEEFHYALQQWAGEMGPNWYKFLGSLDMLHDTKLMFL